MGIFDFFKGKSKAESEVDELREKLMKEVFPGGSAEVTKYAQSIKKIFNDKLTQSECEAFVRGSKTVIHIAEDKTPERIVPSMMHRSKGKVTEEEAYQAYIYLSNGGISYSGGDGLNRNNPIIITASTSLMGIPAEYAYLKKQFGEEGKDWEMTTKLLLKSDQGRQVEAFALKLANGSEVTVYFDITSFFGKF